MTIQAYMPAFVEGKKEGMHALATVILGELNAYANAHADEPPPAPDLYRRLIELCKLAKKNEPLKVYAVIGNSGNVYGVYSAKPLADSQLGLLNGRVEEWEVKDEVGN